MKTHKIIQKNFTFISDDQGHRTFGNILSGLEIPVKFPVIEITSLALRFFSRSLKGLTRTATLILAN